MTKSGHADAFDIEATTETLDLHKLKLDRVTSLGQ
jgi:hypothetical protein